MLATDASQIRDENTIICRLFNKTEKTRNKYMVHAFDYSTNCNVLFCVACVFFASGKNGFRTTGFKVENYTAAHKQLCKHEDTKAHKKALAAYLQLTEDHIQNLAEPNNNDIDAGINASTSSHMPPVETTASTIASSSCPSLASVTAASATSTSNTIVPSSSDPAATISHMNENANSVQSIIQHNRHIVEHVIRCVLFLVSFGRQTYFILISFLRYIVLLKLFYRFANSNIG